MKQLLNRNWLYIAGAILAAVVGFAYWKIVGCETGTCAITSKPINSTLYFAMMGMLVFGLFKKSKKVVE
jgi:hypothetical protein